MDSLLRLLMGPWTTYILWVLRNDGPTRFGELKRRVAGISAKMLTERLRMLEDAGVVFRDYRASVPPQVTYGLTPRGEELKQALDALSDLAIRWQEADAAEEADAARVDAAGVDAASVDAVREAEPGRRAATAEAPRREAGGEPQRERERPAAANPANPLVNAAE